jgi:hypothetical protein
VLAAADSPFTSAAVGTIAGGALDRMRNIPDGGATRRTRAAASAPSPSPGRRSS